MIEQQNDDEEKDNLLEEMALFIEKVQNSNFYIAMTKEGKQLLFDLITRFNAIAPHLKQNKP